jgi:kynurenine formamidase
LGIDPGADTSFGANRLLLAEHRIHLENLAGLGEMPPSGGWIIVGASGYGAARAHRPPCSG